MKRYETDVLIVGGGGAATASAISAHQNGAKTMLIVKGQFGVPGVRGAGATSNPLGDYWTIRTVGPKGGFFNPPDLVYRDMLQTGLGMADPTLCRIFVDEVSDAVARLQEMGLRFKNKILATMPANAGSGGTNHIVAVQKAVLEETGTAILEHGNVIDLVIRNGRCIGVIGIDDDADPFLVESGAVVLATGGVGQLFRYSFNPSGNTGDAYAMALRAGAALFNMEFMQQGLATTWPTKAMVMLYGMEKPYRLINSQGKAFLQDYVPQGENLENISKTKSFHWPVSCRDCAIHLDRAIKGEAVAGRGTETGGVFLDLSGTRRGFEPELFTEFMLSKGIDIERDLVQVQVHHHTSNGGIRIDSNGQSSVTGLFAAGEAAGWQGADRLGGTMLGGSQVFGWRAGRHAAKVAESRPNVACGTSELELLTERLSKIHVDGDLSPADLLAGLQQVMWETLIVEKDGDTLARAKQFIADDRDRLASRLRVTQPFEMALAFEHQNLLDVADVIVSAASMRAESRGSHHRRDYPKRDDANWLTNIFVTRSNGELSLRKQWVAAETGWIDQPDDVRIRPWG